MEQKNNQPWKIWLFVIGLNLIGLVGAIYLQSKGINVFSLGGKS